MRRHGAHMWMCGAIVVSALVIILFSGNALTFLPAVGCVLMMVVMMQMMGGMGAQSHPRGGGKPD